MYVRYQLKPSGLSLYCSTGSTLPVATTLRPLGHLDIMVVGSLKVSAGVSDNDRSCASESADSDGEVKLCLRFFDLVEGEFGLSIRESYVSTAF